MKPEARMFEVDGGELYMFRPEHMPAVGDLIVPPSKRLWRVVSRTLTWTKLGEEEWQLFVKREHEDAELPRSDQ